MLVHWLVSRQCLCSKGGLQIHYPKGDPIEHRYGQKIVNKRSQDKQVFLPLDEKKVKTGIIDLFEKHKDPIPNNLVYIIRKSKVAKEGKNYRIRNVRINRVNGEFFCTFTSTRWLRTYNGVLVKKGERWSQEFTEIQNTYFPR